MWMPPVALTPCPAMERAASLARKHITPPMCLQASLARRAEAAKGCSVRGGYWHGRFPYCALSPSNAQMDGKARSKPNRLGEEGLAKAFSAH
jgi:hypothetical protein